MNDKTVLSMTTSTARQHARLVGLSLAAVLLVTAGATRGLMILNEMADANRHNEVVLARIGKLLYESQTAERSSLRRGRLDDEAEKHLASTRQELANLVETLRFRRSLPDELKTVVTTYREYTLAADDELRFMKNGNSAAAIVVNDQRVAPTFIRLQNLIDRTVGQLGQRAQWAVQTLNTAVVVLMLATVAVVGVFLWLLSRLRSRQVITKAEDKFLREKNVALQAEIVKRSDLEDALRQNEARFRTLIENASDLITILDPQGTIWYQSPSSERVLGYRAAELEGRSVFDLIHPEDKLRLKELLQGGLGAPGNTQAIDFRCRHHNGSWRLFNGTARNLLATPPLSGILVNSRDITEQASAIDDLRRSEEQYRSLFETMQEGFTLCEIVCDKHNRAQDFRFLEVNAAFERLTGLRAEEVIGQTVRQVIPTIEPTWIDTFGKVALTGKPVRFDRMLHQLGKHFEVAAFSPRPQHFAALYTDITEHKRAEEQLRKLSRAIDQSPNSIIITDRSGNIEYVNLQFCRMTGYTVEEVVGQNPRFLKSGETTAAEYKVLWDTITSGGVWTGEFHNRKKSGEFFWEAAIISPLTDAAGKITHFIAVKQDLTEQKQMRGELDESKLRLSETRDELVRTQQQVIQQERLTALGTMASGIAHDFNNSLTSILGFSELLLNHPNTLTDKAKTRRYLEVINTAAQDASAIVGRLREFYRKREKDEVFTPINLNDLVEQSITLTKPKWKAETEARSISIHIRTDLHPVPSILGSPADLREVLTNLIINAIDALPKGGEIVLRTIAQDSKVRLEVRDTGTGMTEEVRQRCFDPFFSTKGDRGTGLGLSMVYGIVLRHNGRIDVESAIDQGTTFIVHLPAFTTPPAKAEPRPTPSVLPQLELLFVDDDPEVRDAIADLLRGDGHRVVTATGARDALAKFRAGKFDVAIIDRAMPNISGDQLAVALKAIKPSLPIVMLTGFGMMMHVAGEQPPGVDWVVSKPVTIQQLRETLASAAAMPPR